MTPQFKLISSNNIDRFEERMNDFFSNLSAQEVIVDMKFATTALANSIEYSVLIHYQTTAAWE